jgi:hypothetical protein
LRIKIKLSQRVYNIRKVSTRCGKRTSNIIPLNTARKGRRGKDGVANSLLRMTRSAAAYTHAGPSRDDGSVEHPDHLRRVIVALNPYRITHAVVEQIIIERNIPLSLKERLA